MVVRGPLTPPFAFVRTGQPIVCALAAILAPRASYRAGATHLPNLRSNHWRTVTVNEATINGR